MNSGLTNWIEHALVPGVRAISTLRTGCDGNYADESHRAALIGMLGGGVRPRWMRQVHGADCVDLDRDGLGVTVVADAALTRDLGHAAAVLTADCLPVLLTSRDGGVVAAVHAGWRGLAAGVIAATVRRMEVAPATLVGVFGPAIGPDAFEVGPEVREVFVREDPEAACAFLPGRGDRVYANLYLLAQMQLRRLGVEPPPRPDWCTHAEERFHSWRRDGRTAGRMAHLIWRDSMGHALPLRRP